MKFKILTVSFLLSSVLVAAPLLADDRFVSTSTDQLSVESVIAYWTEERMKNAIPYPMYSPERSFVEEIPAEIASQADGEPGLSIGGSAAKRRLLQVP